MQSHRYPIQLLSRFRLSFAVGLFLILGAGSFAYAVTWVGPTRPPAVYDDLTFEVPGFEDIVSRTDPSVQSLDGPLALSAGDGGSYPGYVAYDAGAGIVIAVAGNASSGTGLTIPTVVPAGSLIGVYGNEPDPSMQGYGIYAYSVSGTAILSRVNAAQDSARLYGRTNIAAISGTPGSGTLFVEGSITSNEQVTAPGTIRLVQGSEVDAGAVSGSASGPSQSPGSAVGIVSAGLFGDAIRATSFTPQSSPATTFHAVLGHGPLGSAGGAYGHHFAGARGEGVIGSGMPGAQNTHGVYGEATNAGGGVGVQGIVESTFTLTGDLQGGGSVIGRPSGAGVYACGNDEAGYFNGDVYVESAVHLGADTDLVDVSGPSTTVIGKIYNSHIYLNQADLQLILQACLGVPSCSGGPLTWFLSYDGPQQGIFDILHDPTNNVVYAGLQGDLAGDGDVMACFPGAGDVCTTSEWFVSYNALGGGGSDGAHALAMDTRNEILYLGIGSGLNQSDIYRCTPGADNVCDTTEWFLAFDHTVSGAAYVADLLYDSENAVLYAGIYAASTGGGAIYRCSPDAVGVPVGNDGDGQCELGEWVLSFNAPGSTDSAGSFSFDTTNGVIYSGISDDADIQERGDVYRCSPGSDGACSQTEWILSFDGTENAILATTYDQSNRVVYAVQGWGPGAGDIFRCSPDAIGVPVGNDGDGLCEPNEWVVSYDGSNDRFQAIVHEPDLNRVFAGEGANTGNGNIYECSAGADYVCDQSEWVLSYATGEDTVPALHIDRLHHVLYAGTRDIGTTDGDIYYSPL